MKQEEAGLSDNIVLQSGTIIKAHEGIIGINAEADVDVATTACASETAG